QQKAALLKNNTALQSVSLRSKNISMMSLPWGCAGSSHSPQTPSTCGTEPYPWNPSLTKR
ncbi:ARHGEF2 isoform 11, partial [Pan troglodytes]